MINDRRNLMNPMNRSLLAALVVSFAASAASAQLQGPSPTVTPDASRIIVSQTEFDRDRPPITPPTADDFLTGEGDLILLDEAELFFARTETTLTLTGNAELADGGQEDAFLLQDFSGGIRTVLDDRWAVYAETGFNARLYLDNNDLDATVAFLRFGGSSRFGESQRLIAGGDVSFDLIRSDFFDEAINDQITFDAYAAYPIGYRGNRLTITPRATIIGVVGDVSDFNKVELVGGVDGAYGVTGEEAPEALRDKLLFLATASVGGRYYPDFFEEFTGSTRSDLFVRVTAGARYFFNDDVAAKVDGSVLIQQSSIGLLDYAEASLGGGIWLEYHF